MPVKPTRKQPFTSPEAAEIGLQAKSLLLLSELDVNGPRPKLRFLHQTAYLGGVERKDYAIGLARTCRNGLHVIALLSRASYEHVPGLTMPSHVHARSWYLRPGYSGYSLNRAIDKAVAWTTAEVRRRSRVEQVRALFEQARGKRHVLEQAERFGRAAGGPSLLYHRMTVEDCERWVRWLTERLCVLPPRETSPDVAE